MTVLRSVPDQATGKATAWHRAALALPERACSEIEAMAGIGMTVSAAPGQTIVLEGDPMRSWYRVLSGAVRLYKAIGDGRRQVIDFLAEGDCFGILGNGRYTYSVEAISPTTLVRHPRASLDAMMQTDPEIAHRLFDLACAELDRAQRQMLLLGRKSADEKIASFLLALTSQLAGPQPGEARSLHLPMSRQDMADYLGLTIETVSRTFSRLKRLGLIRLPTPHDVVLARLADLQALADGTTPAAASQAAAC